MSAVGSLSPDEAKARLRAAGQEIEVASWVREWPFTTLLLAAVAGGVAARVPSHRLIGFLDLLLQVVLCEDPKPRVDEP